jgi:hypothetical protein
MSSASTRHLRRAGLLLVLGGLLGALLVTGAGVTGGLLLFAPALLLFALLLGDVYVGEDAIHRARARRYAVPARRRIAQRVIGWRSDAALGHAPTPLARRALAMRPPPALGHA